MCKGKDILEAIPIRSHVKQYGEILGYINGGMPEEIPNRSPKEIPDGIQKKKQEEFWRNP